jgi:hypothetical protein
MISERGISLLAIVMIHRYGSNAWIEAAKRADDHVNNGDREGSAMWQRTVAAIETLQAEKPEPGETVQ